MGLTSQLLVFELDGRRYGLHLSQVERVIRAVDLTPLPRDFPMVSGIIDLHGEIIPVLDIRKKLGIARREVGVDDHFIIAHARRRKVALIADTTTGVIESPTEAIVKAQNILPQFEQIEGILQLEDGLLLIHDLDRFLSQDEERLLDEALGGQSHGK